MPAFTKASCFDGPIPFIELVDFERSRAFSGTRNLFPLLSIGIGYGLRAIFRDRDHEMYC